MNSKISTHEYNGDGYPYETGNFEQFLLMDRETNNIVWATTKIVKDEKPQMIVFHNGAIVRAELNNYDFSNLNHWNDVGNNDGSLKIDHPILYEISPGSVAINYIDFRLIRREVDNTEWVAINPAKPAKAKNIRRARITSR